MQYYARKTRSLSGEPDGQVEGSGRVEQAKGRVSFHDLRIRHNIPLGELIRITPTVAPNDIIQLDQAGKAETYVVDLLLASLSRLSGARYTRSDVGEVTFLLSANHGPGKRLRILPAQPTLSQLRHYYDLSIYKISQATDLDPKVVYFMFLGQPALRMHAEAVLYAISRFTSKKYTLYNTHVELIEEVMHKQGVC